MNNNKKKYIKKLSTALLTLFLIPSLSACPSGGGFSDGTSGEDKEVFEKEISSTLLKEGQDMGEEYIDSFIFLGESTTYHLKSRGVLKDGKSTKQVWAPKSGTMCLDASVENLKIVYPQTNEEITISEALRRSLPKRIFLCFGLNGAIRNVSGDGAYFKACYEKLINIIKDASPDTEIILGSCYPIAKNMDTSAYPCSAETLNSYIDVINGYVFELAEENGVYYLDTSSILKDSEGYLKSEFQAGDGYHLTSAAYRVILRHIRTHGTR